jgi:hypothetical protein
VTRPNRRGTIQSVTGERNVVRSVELGEDEDGGSGCGDGDGTGVLVGSSVVLGWFG